MAADDVELDVVHGVDVDEDDVVHGVDVDEDDVVHGVDVDEDDVEHGVELDEEVHEVDVVDIDVGDGLPGTGAALATEAQRKAAVKKEAKKTIF
jgi:hypothetical protein